MGSWLSSWAARLPGSGALAVLGLRGRRPAAAAAPDPTPHAERSGFPAPAGFIRPLPPRVKLSAPRRVQKPVVKGEGRPAAKGAPARSPSTSPQLPWGLRSPPGLPRKASAPSPSADALCYCVGTRRRP